MGVIITEEVKELLEDPNTKTVLATTDPDGNPHVVFKGSIRANEDGYLEYYELIETSQTNRNMVHSIWFRKKVAVTLQNGAQSWQIKGTPYQAVIAGQKFEDAYRRIQDRFGNIDLSTVWLIEPEEIINENLETRRTDEESAHPLLRHLDRLVV